MYLFFITLLFSDGCGSHAIVCKSLNTYFPGFVKTNPEIFSSTKAFTTARLTKRNLIIVLASQHHK